MGIIEQVRQIVENTQAGALATCERCGRLCRVADTRTENARLLKHSATTQGYCINCGVTEFLRSTPVISQLIEERMKQVGPKIFLWEPMQKQFTEILKVGLADADGAELDWQWIGEHWDLPLSHEKGKGKRKKRTPKPEE